MPANLFLNKNRNKCETAQHKRLTNEITNGRETEIRHVIRYEIKQFIAQDS